MVSGLRVIKPRWAWWPRCLDIYPNAHLLKSVAAPVLIIHGTRDEVIDIAHGRALHAAARAPAEPLWLEGGTHQDLESFPQYAPHLKDFIASRLRPAGL